MKEFIAQYGAQIMYTIITAVAAYIGVQLKKIYEKYINDKQKEAIVKNVVKAVEQIYKDLDGKEKLEKAAERINGLLCAKGLCIDDLELNTLIEAAVTELKYNFAPSKIGADVVEEVINEEKAEVEK